MAGGADTVTEGDAPTPQQKMTVSIANINTAPARQGQRKDSITEDSSALNNNNNSGPKVRRGRPNRSRPEADVEEEVTGSKRKMSGETSQVASKRRTTVSGGGGGGAAKAEMAGSSNSMAFAWPVPPPEQAMNPSIQNEAHDSNITAHLRSLDPNNPPPQHSMMSSIAFANDRRMSMPDNLSSAEPATGPSRALRSRSRPPSRQLRGTDQTNPSAPSSGDNTEEPTSAPSPGGHKRSSPSAVTPYSRSPELRVSHKLAERKRRKEMKELFDELRDQLPADRGMKASKWEILSKAIDFVAQLKQNHQEMAREIDILRHELDGVRGGVSAFGPGGQPHPVVYGQPPLVSQQYAAGAMPHQPSHPLSRPPSSQNAFPPGGGPAQQQSQQSPSAQNGNTNLHRVDVPQS